MISISVFSNEEKELIFKKGLKAIYFKTGYTTLYSAFGQDGGLVSLISVKFPSAYLLFNKAPSESERLEIVDFLNALKVKEIVSDEQIFPDMQSLYICRYAEKGESFFNGITEAKGRDYDLCHGLLTEVGFVLPEKDEYYVISFERAKNNMKTYLVKENETALSTAAVLGAFESYALIGAVATSKAARNRGLASKTVLHIASTLKKEKKIPLITYFDEKAGKIYKSIGFKKEEIIYIKTEKRS